MVPPKGRTESSCSMLMDPAEDTGHMTGPDDRRKIGDLLTVVVVLVD